MSKQKAKQHQNCSRGFRPVVGVMSLPFQGCARIAGTAAALVFHLQQLVVCDKNWKKMQNEKVPPPALLD